MFHKNYKKNCVCHRKYFLSPKLSCPCENLIPYNDNENYQSTAADFMFHVDCTCTSVVFFYLFNSLEITMKKFSFLNFGPVFYTGMTKRTSRAEHC